MYKITGLPAFHDNYIWMLTDSESQSCFVVDPGDASVVSQYCQDNQLTLTGILITHHHPDHIGGIAQLVSESSAQLTVYGPVSENIKGISHPLTDGDTVSVLGQTLEVIGTPGHTLDHITYFDRHREGRDDAPALFAGDTLFSGGCGRLFEGTPEQMHHSLMRLANLPGETHIYCAHEYTQANMAFAKAVEPDNTQLIERAEQVDALRLRNLPTIPALLSVELVTNPFLRAGYDTVQRAASRYSGETPTSPEQAFAIIRRWKDNF